MYLKALEIQGFKSFPDKTVLNFGEDITAIVGPNGSGKSNISDAIRWVMGEQNSRQLRGAKMEDVIFGGTEKRNQMGFAQVTLVIDNTEHIFPTREEAEVAVTRRYYRSGESEYYINKQSVRLKDVNELFMDTGMGREGYSIIGQGKIDEILSVKSGERREIFEEAAGISKYRHRKEESERKLERTEENLVRINDKIAELELQVEPLRAQAETAKQYLIYRDELRLLEISVWLENLETLKTNAIKLDTDLSLAREELKKANADLEALYAASEQFSARIHENDIAQEEKRAQLSELDAQVKEQESAVAVLQTGIAHNEENIARVEEELRSQSDRVGSMDAQIAQQRARIEELERSKNEVETALAALLKQAEELSKNAGEAASEAETLRGREALALSAAADSRAEVAALRSTLSEMDEHESAIAAEQESGEAQLSETRKSAAENRRALESAQEEADAIRNIIAGHTMKMQGRIEREKETGEQHVSLTMEMNNLDSRIRLLSEMEKEYEGFNKAVRTVMQASERKALRGVRGPVANLMKVDKKYAVAIEIALGAGLQNIVVEREEDAKSAIQLLKQRDGGRATFLPLSSIRGEALRDARVQNEYGYVGLASELVEYERAYDGIFKNLLGRTVVVEDLDCGITISRRFSNAFRIVTLDGQVLNRGGSMTGGSAQSKVSNLLSRERELKELTAKLQTGRAELDKCRQELTQRQQTAQEKRQKVSDAVNALHQQEIAVAREQARRESVFADLNTHLQRMQETEQARVQLHQSLEDIRQQLETIEHQRTGAQGDQSAMEQKTIEMQNALVKARAEASAENDRLMVRTLQLSDLRHGLSDLERDEAHAQQDQAQILREQERREQLLHEMDELDAIDENDMKREEAESARRQKEQLRQESAAQAIEQRRSQAQSDLRDILSDMENLHEAYNRDSEKLHKTELAKARIEGDQKNLQNRIWDTYKLTYAGAEEFRRTPFDEKESDCRAAELQGQIRALGTVNVGAVEEYAETKARVDDLTAQQQDLKRAEMDLRELIERLLIQMRSTFVENFSKMQGYFAETFTRLFGGGHAELKLMDPDDPLNCGIEVNAQPPGKKLQLLSLLSGGERALTAIAILFAMLKLKPTPFCILDEIEAALDDANIGYYADYLKEYSKGTQFIVVTHRKGTMERCNSLFGVAMEEQGVSRMVSVSLQDYQE